MSNHTPGPWIFDNEIGFIRTDTSPYGEWAVANVNIVRAEAKANARLIAAAPDLLDALKWIADQTYDPWTNGAEAQRHALNAIAKATGEQA